MRPGAGSMTSWNCSVVLWCGSYARKATGSGQSGSRMERTCVTPCVLWDASSSRPQIVSKDTNTEFIWLSICHRRRGTKQPDVEAGLIAALYQWAKSHQRTLGSTALRLTAGQSSLRHATRAGEERPKMARLHPKAYAIMPQRHGPAPPWDVVVGPMFRAFPRIRGLPSKTPAQGVPQSPQQPSAVRFQTVRSYQSRPISVA